MSKFRDGMIGPSIILCAICLVVTVALAATYQMTLPVILASEAESANESRRLVLPEGDNFIKIEDVNLPEGMLEAYVAENGAGYVFMAQAKGYGGYVTFIVGVDANGNYVGIDMFDHEETKGLGTKVGEEAYLENYYGHNDPDSVDAISGVTKTSNALKTSLLICNETFDLLAGKGA